MHLHSRLPPTPTPAPTMTTWPARAHLRLRLRLHPVPPSSYLPGRLRSDDDESENAEPKRRKNVGRCLSRRQIPLHPRLPRPPTKSHIVQPAEPQEPPTPEVQQQGEEPKTPSTPWCKIDIVGTLQDSSWTLRLFVGYGNAKSILRRAWWRSRSERRIRNRSCIASWRLVYVAWRGRGDAPVIPGY
jgi:hypothetical protein